MKKRKKKVVNRTEESFNIVVYPTIIHFLVTRKKRSGEINGEW